MNTQQLLTKYAKKFAHKGKSRPILEGIHYGKDSTVFITDGCYAIRIKNAHHFPEPVTIHAVSGTPVDGVYPDVSKIVPASFENDITIERYALEQVIIRTRCAADVASRLVKNAPTVTLAAANGEAYLQIKNESQQLELSAFFGQTRKVEPSKRSLNAEYLHTALSVFADAGSDKVIVKISGPLSPILLTDENDIDVLIIPYRVAPE